MARFTPEPWRVTKEIISDVGLTKIQSEHRVIAVMFRLMGTIDNDIDANAQLIAAAPALYEALINIENDDGRIPDTIWKMRNDALALAGAELGVDYSRWRTRRTQSRL